MAIALSMWNFHNWLEQRNIPHIFSIRNNKGTISDIRLAGPTDNVPCDCAVVTHTDESSEYTAVLSYEDDRIFFRNRRVTQVMDELGYMLTSFSEWEQSLLRINLSHGSLTTLLSACTNMLPAKIAVYDAAHLLACSPEHETFLQEQWTQLCSLSLPEMLRLLPPDSVSHSQYAAEEPVLIYSPLQRGQQILHANVLSSQGHSVHIIALPDSRPFSPGDIHFLRCLSRAVACCLSLQEEQPSAQRLTPQRFFADYLASGTWKTAQEAAVLRQLGWNANDRYAIFQLELRTPSTSPLIDKLSRLLKEQCPIAFCLLHGPSLYLICNNSPASASKVLKQIAELPPTVFISSQSNFSASFSALPQLFSQAEIALQTARQQKLSFLSFEDILTDYIYHTFAALPNLQGLVHPAVRLLVETDQQKQTSLTRTLLCYLQTGENCNATARELGIHRSSLLMRLERIASLTGVNLDDPDTQQALYLSLIVSGFSKNASLP